MSITLTVDEDLLRAAERATDIHDWQTLVQKGLQALCRTSEASRKPPARPFDFDAALAAAAALPDLADAEFERFEQEMNRPLPPAWSE
ncbi:MAG TPA: hypothetical protein VGO11_21000 [Chthoniobacteraceae bacterium]|jgi:hypothetical protein|nr:hypothetical protein [Chthoniobacteraceae bacterium]